MAMYLAFLMLCVSLSKATANVNKEQASEPAAASTHRSPDEMNEFFCVHFDGRFTPKEKTVTPFPNTGEQKTSVATSDSTGKTHV